jgi:UDPglucose 6-dehydrogenase
MDDACVIGGLGMVGKATAKALSIPYYFDLLGSNITLEEAAEKRFIFICLPTPTIKGRCDTHELSEVIKQIKDYGRQNIFVVRSTVNPGFCSNLSTVLGVRNVVHVPEFLTEATWEEDIKTPDIVVIGADSKDYREAVEGVYRARYQRGVEIILTDSITSELLKWAINGFYATKVVYANEIYDFAQKIGANYEVIKDTMYKRKWIGKNHLNIWRGDQRGAGGKCLPKDLEALAEMSQSSLLLKVLERNDLYTHRK